MQLFQKERKNSELERVLFELRNKINSQNNQFEVLSSRFSDNSKK